MTDKYISIAEATEKYKLNISKITLAVRKAAQNGLYKAVFRKRSRIYLHQSHLEKWLESNDVTSPSQPNKGRKKRFF